MIQFIHVSKFYKKNWPVLDDLSLTVDPGEFLFVTGKSGAGKSTFLNHIYFKEKPSRGQVIVDNTNSQNAKARDIPKLRRKLGMIFQEFFLLSDRSVFENIALPLRLAGRPGADIKVQTLKILAYTGLSHKMNEKPAFLSSGEKQRICIARALVHNPLVILADEPTGNLDTQNADDIFRLLKNIHAQGTAVIMATHNENRVQEESFRRVHLESGKIKE